MKKTIDQARLLAHRSLLRLWREGGQLDERDFRELEPNARARALRLARETLRHEAGFNRIIKDNAKAPPQEPVRALLHIGFHELLIDNSAPHGVIDSWVEIAKADQECATASGFVNALLRKSSQERPKLIPTNQYGKALRKHLQKFYDSSTLDQINKIQSHYPPVDLALKAGENLNEWAKKLNANPIHELHALRLNDTTQISTLEGYQDGKWWVQDLAAQGAILAFENLKGKHVLDLCAAPGGKSMQLVDHGAIVTAVEISPTRAKRIEANLKRTKLDANLVLQDVLNFQDGSYDAILLDAPCSATGTIRRHPDLRYDDPLARMKALTPLQEKMLNHAFTLLKPQGELVYCTCSLLHEEGEEQIEKFLKTHPDAKLSPLANPFTKATSPQLRLLPNLSNLEHGTDGFFIAKITKAGE